MIQMGRMHEVDTTRAWLRSCSSTCPACSSRTSQSSGLSGSMSTRDAEGTPFLSRTSTISDEDIPSDCASADGTCRSNTSAQNANREQIGLPVEHAGPQPEHLDLLLEHLGISAASALLLPIICTLKATGLCLSVLFPHLDAPHSLHHAAATESHATLSCSPRRPASAALWINCSPQCPRAMHSYRRPS
jgi:hypothetical protein